MTLIRRMQTMGLPFALATFVTLAGSLAAQNAATANASTTNEQPDAVTEAVEEVVQPRAPWLVTCSNQMDAAVLQCDTAQSIIAGPQNQRLATVSVLRSAGEDEATGLFTLPIGLNLPAGLTLTVDETELMNIPLQSCDAQGCYAMNALEPGQITAMKDGNELILTVQSQAQEDIRISFELRGFAQSLTLMDK